MPNGDVEPTTPKRVVSKTTLIAGALGAAALIVTLISAPVGGRGALPCRILSERVDTALKRRIDALPLLWAAFYADQY